MTATAEEGVPRGDLAKAASRDAEVSISSATTQTRFSFYNAEDFSTREEPNPNRFNFYSDELQRQVTALPPSPLEAPSSQALEANISLERPENKPDSIEILRALQHHEQQRLTILDNYVDESVEVSTEKSNPYEDAIKEALALLRKHRDTGSSSSSFEGHMPASISPLLQGRPPTIDTNQARHNLDHEVGEILFHAQTELPESSQSNVPIFEGSFYPSTPSDVMTPGSASALGDAYQAEIEARRRQRQERMAKYATRLAELKQENGTVASSSSHHDGMEDEHEQPDLVTPIPLLSLSASDIHRHPSQPIVAFSSNQIPHVASGLTTSSRTDEFHQQQVQLGVEKVLLAILDRANSGSRGQQQAQSTVWRQEEKKSYSDEVEPVRQQQKQREEGGDNDDPLVQAMSNLLLAPTSIFSDGMPLMGREQLEQTLDIDTLRDIAVDSDVQKTSSVNIPETIRPRPSELRLSHSDPGPEAHAELDRMVEEVLKKNSEGADSYASSDMYTSDPINQRVRQILTASSNEASVSKAQHESENILQDDEDSDINDSAGHDDSIEDGLDAETDHENRYEDEASSESDSANPAVLNGVLGPLSALAGGTTRVVLEPDSSDDSPSLFDSISAAARNFVAGVSGSSESEAASSDAETSLSNVKQTTQTYELMQTLFAHLISAEFPGPRKN